MIEFEPKEIVFLDEGGEHLLPAMSAVGAGIAYLKDPAYPERTKYIVVHEPSGIAIQRNWGCEREEQIVALIEKIAPLLEWNRPAKTLFDGLTIGYLEFHNKVDKAFQEVGGTEAWDEEEEDYDEEEEEERTPEQNVELAEAALERMSEEWIQNGFGSELTDVIFDALNLYIEHQKSPSD